MQERGEEVGTALIAAARVVVAFVGVELGRAPAGSTGTSPWPDDGRDRIHQLFKQQRVVGVGGRQANRQRDPGGVDQQVVLGAGLARSTGFAPVSSPRRARTLTESMAARDQSTWPSSPSQSNNR
jgi:hypothetical protein